MEEPQEEGPREAQRRLLVHRYGLESFQRQEDVNELAEIGRAIWGETVLVTAVLPDQQVVILGSSLAEGDNTDWDRAVRTLSPIAALKTSEPVKPRSVLVVDDATKERQSEISGGEAVGFYAFAPVHLPIGVASLDGPMIPVGGFIVVSPNSRPAGSFSAADQALLLSLSNLVVKELQRGYDSILLKKKASQATFLSHFLELALTAAGPPRPSPGASTRRSSGDSGDTSSAESCPSVTSSPAVSAYQAFKLEQQPETFQGRHGHVFSEAVDAICDVNEGISAVILDLRAFSCSTKLDQLQLQARAHLQPVSVLGSRGFGDDVATKLAGQVGLRAIEDALDGWRKNPSGAAFRTNALHFLLPDSSRSSLSIPILDHTKTPVLLVLVSSSDPPPMGKPSPQDSAPSNILAHTAPGAVLGLIEESDKSFMKSVGQLCLSTLLKDQSVKSDRAKLAFVSQIAHELRTPLHGLSGQLDHVREEATPEEASKFAPLLHIADVCLESLRSILDDTLDFAKLTSDVELGVTLPLPTNDSVDLPIFMESVAKACWTRKLKLSSASASGDGDFERGPSDILDVVFSFAGRGEGWMAKVNAGELRRIISNVFSNAIAATHVGFVCLQLDAAPKPGPDGLTMLSIRISDSGIGMSPAFLEQVYTPFVQADPFAPGCGLGLSIVKDLVTRMHGTIQIDSVLDEGENYCRICEFCVLGYDVKAVDDGQEAVDEFKREYRPDLSVLDIGMPRKDGLEAAHEIRAHEEVMGWERHRMIALTALSSAEERQKGVGFHDAPFDRWVVKGGKALKMLEDELLAMSARMGDDRGVGSSG